MTTALARRTTALTPVPVIRLTSVPELVQFAEIAAKSSFIPKDYQGRAANIILAVQLASELGLTPLQSLQSVAVVNGRPTVLGDAMLALCRASPFFEDIKESIEGEQMTAVCVVRRRGASPVTARFSVADAKRAGLWGKQGPWSTYPTRMLQMRAARAIELAPLRAARTSMPRCRSRPPSSASVPGWLISGKRWRPAAVAMRSRWC